MMYGIELVVETHGEVCACIWSNMCREWAFYLINCVIHINSSLANLHVLKAGFHTKTEKALKETQVKQAY